jgi:hypothetical protein
VVTKILIADDNALIRRGLPAHSCKLMTDGKRKQRTLSRVARPDGWLRSVNSPGVLSRSTSGRSRPSQ